MKSLNKKITSLLLAASLITSTGVLSGCTNKNDGINNSEPSEQVENIKPSDLPNVSETPEESDIETEEKIDTELIIFIDVNSEYAEKTGIDKKLLMLLADGYVEVKETESRKACLTTMYNPFEPTSSAILKFTLDEASNTLDSLFFGYESEVNDESLYIVPTEKNEKFFFFLAEIIDSEEFPSELTLDELKAIDEYLNEEAKTLNKEKTV